MSNYHLTIAVRGRRALARDEAERRWLVRSLTRVGGNRLLLFGLADDHLHGGLRAERPSRVAEGLRRMLVAVRPDLELKQPHLEPVGNRAYLRWLVGPWLRAWLRRLVSPSAPSHVSSVSCHDRFAT